MEHPSTEHIEPRIDLVVSWIKHADAKAGITLSGAAAISAVAATQLVASPIPARVSFVLAVVAAGVAGYWAWSALVPRTLPHERREESLLFFGSLARVGSAKELVIRMREQTPEACLTDYAHQLRELSVIAAAKFDRVDKAINSVAGAALLLSIALLIEAFL